MDIAYKALAVNLSDLAAMGATPAWFTLALTLPDLDEQWLQAFSQGLAILTEQYKMPLVGGDTTKGPLSITVQIAGHVPVGQALKRSGARPGDDIYVSGTLGWAALGLADLLGKSNDLISGLSPKDRQLAVDRILRPTPRIQLGEALRELASACIDLSDGLLADLGHLLSQSQVGARLDLESLPVATGLDTLPVEHRLEYVSFGDDYELLFTAPERHLQHIQSLAHLVGVQLTRIGKVNDLPGKLTDQHGQILEQQGYNHFRL